MPTLPEQSYASKSETMQHTLYGNALALPLVFLGALTYVAKRNVKNDDDADDEKK